MGQTLTHGIYLPDEGERNCYSGLAANWQILDNSVGTIAAHTAALAGKAPLVHTHTKSDITDFPALANVATSGSYNDLSNIPASFTPASHSHGNITNDGKVGTAENKPLITGTGGVVQAGSFGNAANTFCEGNDSRLSDARTPVAHTHTKSNVTDLFNSANTWSGSNTYSSNVNLYNSDNTQNTPTLYLRNSKATISSSGNTAGYQGIYFNDSNNATLAYIRGAIQSNGCVFNLKTFAKNSNNNTVESGVQIGSFADGSKWLAPSENGTISLGGINYKWKTLNGINPGALSLPARDYVSSMDVDTTDWDVTGTTFYYTPNIDGWLQISVSPNNNYAYIAVEYATLRDNCENTTGRNAMLTVPVVANKRYDITIIGSTIARARLAPAQGNV